MDVGTEMICHCQNAVIVFVNGEQSDEVHGNGVTTFIRDGQVVEWPSGFAGGGFVAEALCT